MNVLELFAGVGGFRIGLENANPDYFRTLWSNQWEPSRSLRMLSRYIIIIFQTVKILILAYLILLMNSSLK